MIWRSSPGRTQGRSGLHMNALSERFAKPQTGRITAEAVATFSALVPSTRSADHAEILAWYAYNSGQVQAAAPVGLPRRPTGSRPKRASRAWPCPMPASVPRPN